MRLVILFLLVSTAVLSSTAVAQDNAFPLALQPNPDDCEKLPARKAKAATDSDAALEAGAALEFGFCGPADPAAAYPFYVLASRQHSFGALVRLGAIHLHRRGGIDDPLRGAREFRAAAAKQYQQIGDTFFPDDPVWTRFAAEWGLDESYMLDRQGIVYGMIFLERGDLLAGEALLSAFAWRQAVAEGPAALKRQWGMRLFNGTGIRQFPLAGLRLMREAEGLIPEDRELTYIIAHARLFGPPATPELPFTATDFRSPDHALWRLFDLAKQGYAPAQLDLGLWMSEGQNGVKLHPLGGYLWLLRA